MEINEIMDLAKTKNGFKSDRALALAIGASQPTVFRIRQGFGYPSEENMLKLGELAGFNNESSLLLLNMWKADGLAKTVYFDILKKLAPTMALCFILFFSQFMTTPAFATVVPPQVYLAAPTNVTEMPSYCILWKLKGSF